MAKQRRIYRSETFGPAYRVDDKLFWSPVPRQSTSLPWGYDVDPEDDKMLIPDDEALRKLEVAKKLRKKYSLRQVALWLSEETGREISHTALMQRIKYEKERGRKASSLRHYANKAQEALRKAYEATEKANRYKPTGRRDGTGVGEGVVRRYQPDHRNFCKTCGHEYNLPTERGSSD